MATLYELSADLILLSEMMDDPDYDKQALLDTLEACEGDFEVKCDGYVTIMREKESEAEKCRKEAQRLMKRAHVCENSVSNLKQALTTAMMNTGKRKFKTERNSFGIQKNPPSVALDVEDWRDVPEDFLTRSEPTINKKKLLEALKNDDPIAARIGHIEQTESVRIR